jgi:hypothetical protein
LNLLDVVVVDVVVLVVLDANKEKKHKRILSLLKKKLSIKSISYQGKCDYKCILLNVKILWIITEFKLLFTIKNSLCLIHADGDQDSSTDSCYCRNMFWIFLATIILNEFFCTRYFFNVYR